MDIDIDRGRIRVGDIRHIIDRNDVHVFEIDLDSKYPGHPQCTVSSDGEAIELWLLSTERTRNVDESAETDTLIRFEVGDARTVCAVADASRYTARLVLYRRGRD